MRATRVTPVEGGLAGVDGESDVCDGDVCEDVAGGHRVLWVDAGPGVDDCLSEGRDGAKDRQPGIGKLAGQALQLLRQALQPLRSGIKWIRLPLADIPITDQTARCSSRLVSASRNRVPPPPRRRRSRLRNG